MYSQTHDIMNKSNKNNNLRKFVSWSRGQATRRTNTNQNQERTIVSKQWRPSSSRANLGVFCTKLILLLAFSSFCVCVCSTAGLGVAVEVALSEETIRFFPISSTKRASKALNIEFMMKSKDNKQDQETLKFPEREREIFQIIRNVFVRFLWFTMTNRVYLYTERVRETVLNGKSEEFGWLSPAIYFQVASWTREQPRPARYVTNCKKKTCHVTMSDSHMIQSFASNPLSFSVFKG